MFGALDFVYLPNREVSADLAHWSRAGPDKRHWMVSPHPSVDVRGHDAAVCLGCGPPRGALVRVLVGGVTLARDDRRAVDGGRSTGKRGCVNDCRLRDRTMYPITCHIADSKRVSRQCADPPPVRHRCFDRRGKACLDAPARSDPDWMVRTRKGRWCW